MTTDLITATETSILRLDFETATPEQMAEAIQFVDQLKARTRELDRQFEQAAIQWLQFHGDLTIGDSRYYVGSQKSVKCHDTKAATEALLQAADGSLEALEQCFVAQPFKAGVTKTILGDEVFDKHFGTVIVPDLKTGKPLRKVQKASLTFTKGRSDEEA